MHVCNSLSLKRLVRQIYPRERVPAEFNHEDSTLDEEKPVLNAIILFCFNVSFKQL